MDANGARYHLLLGQADWERCELDSLEYDEMREELVLQRRVLQFTAPPHDDPPSLEERRGAARDRFGNTYWIEGSGSRLLVLSAGDRVASSFWPATRSAPPIPAAGGFGEVPESRPAPPPPPRLCGLSVTEDHYLVAGMLEPPGLLIFDLHGGGEPMRICWPATSALRPFDMAPRPGGGVWILDRENRRYWELNRHFHVVPLRAPPERTPVRMTFEPLDSSVERGPLEWAGLLPITDEEASPLQAADPIAIEGLPDSTVLILDRRPGQAYSAVLRYRGSELIDSLSLEAMGDLLNVSDRTRFRLTAHDFVFAPQFESREGSVPDRLFIASSEGNQAFALHCFLDEGRARLKPLTEFYPLRLFGGKGLVRAEERVYYDIEDRWVQLAEQPRPRYAEAGILVSFVFDGHEPDTLWHRLLIDACIPSQTAVHVYSKAADDPGQLSNVNWQREPDPYLRGRGSELPWLSRAETPGSGTWELLFQKARGRYLNLRLVLNGDGKVSPRIHALRAYYPRFSYTRYLPALYREDSESASFLDRFLANMEGIYTTIEDRIASAPVLFDPVAAPSESLDWLASWFDVVLDPVWEDERRRLFLQHAVVFFQFRGTIRGLQMSLHLSFDPHPNAEVFLDPDRLSQRPGSARIVEKYRTRKTPPAVLGDPNEISVPREVSADRRWLPEQGSERLHDLYRDAFGLPQDARFPVKAPPEGQTAPTPGQWREFCLVTLGFVPSAGAAELPLWQAFLARRYPSISSLRQAYAAPWREFQEATLLESLPTLGEALQDWYQFEGVVMAMHRAAHRFTVLLPVPKGASGNSPEAQRQLEMARRIIEIEKPAHTVFDVKFFWAMFRVGEARLGLDTMVELGGRAPDLLPPLVLGRNFLSESYLEPAPSEVARDRMVLRCGSRERLCRSSRGVKE
jgi:phage tail-like protein